MADRLREVAKIAMNRVQDVQVGLLRLVGAIDYPVPPNSNMRRTNAKTLKHYYFSSLTTHLPIVTMARFFGVNFAPGDNILDFGCGAGGQLMSMTRYFPGPNYYACDVDPSSIAFVKRNYPTVDARTTGFMPPLPFADGQMDLTYTVSTFSHFDLATTRAWIAELFRITRPGGLVLPTIEGVHALSHVAGDARAGQDEVERTVEREGIFYKEYAWFQTLKRRGPAITPNVDTSTYFGDTYGHTVMSERFVQEEFAKAGFEVLGIAEAVIATRQDLVVLRRPAH